MQKSNLFFAVVLAGLGFLFPVQAQENPEIGNDLLTLANGAVLISASAEPHLALALTDGDLDSNWNSSTKRNPPPYVFVFELLAAAQLTQIGIDGAGPRPGGVAGGSAKQVLIEGSMTGPQEGYVELARIEAFEDGMTLADVSTDMPVRWLRFTVEGAQVDASWIYFDEVLAFGTLTPPTDEERFSGIFQTGRANFIELKQDGAA